MPDRVDSSADTLSKNTCTQQNAKGISSQPTPFHPGSTATRYKFPINIIKREHPIQTISFTIYGSLLNDAYSEVYIPKVSRIHSRVRRCPSDCQPRLEFAIDVEARSALISRRYAYRTSAHPEKYPAMKCRMLRQVLVSPEPPTDAAKVLDIRPWRPAHSVNSLPMVK